MNDLLAQVLYPPLNKDNATYRRLKGEKTVYTLPSPVRTMPGGRII